MALEDEFEDLDEKLEDRYTKAGKKRLLMTAMSKVPALRDIQKTDENRVAATPGAVSMSYKTYLGLLETATVRYDDQASKAKSEGRASRSANEHDYNPFDLHVNAHIGDYTDHGHDFVAQAPPPTPPMEPPLFDAYSTQMQRKPNPNRPWIPKELWSLIMQHPDVVAAWNAYDWNSAPANASITQRRQQTQAQVHEQMYREFIGLSDSSSDDRSTANSQLDVHQAVRDVLHDILSQSPDNSRGVHTDSNPNSDSKSMLAHLTQQKPIPSGNLRHLIHQAAQQSSKSGQHDDKTVTFKGKQYRQ